MTGRVQSSVERVQDAAFESLIKQYTERREWAVLELVNILYGKVLSDREHPPMSGVKGASVV